MIILILILCIIIYLLVNQPKQVNKDDMIKALLRQTTRWAVASQQDKSPMVAVLHANYAIGYLMALRDIASEKEINRFVNLYKLNKLLLQIQDAAAMKTIKYCPEFASELNKELALIGMKFI
jgi:hypothetical protein